jgi:hypothetical protein
MLAEGFIKQVLVLDTPPGHAVGWNPNGVATSFEITEVEANNDAVVVNVDNQVSADPVCSASQTFAQQIEIWCTSPPADEFTLIYTVIERIPLGIIG